MEPVSSVPAQKWINNAGIPTTVDLELEPNREIQRVERRWVVDRRESVCSGVKVLCRNVLVTPLWDVDDPAIWTKSGSRLDILWLAGGSVSAEIQAHPLTSMAEIVRQKL